MDYTEFFQLYDEVFDQGGNIRACGRSACRALIKVCKEIWNDGYWGDEKTGKIEAVAIRQKYREIMSGEEA